ncbi:hypothetical protein pipiens_019398, partial [Culex pipiens pipiens]
DTARILDMSDNTTHPNQDVTSLNFNCDGTLLATGSSDRCVRIWRTLIWIAETTVDYAVVQSKSLEGGEASLVTGHEEA